jgi:hypothetical protein
MYSFVNSWTICHHSFHLGFLFPKGWFYTLSKVLFNNNSSNSFNLLFNLIGRMGLSLFSCTLVISYWPSQFWIWVVKLCFSLSNSMWAGYLLFPKILISMFQIGYDTLLFQTRLLHFGIILCHLLQISLETNQIILGFPIELVEFNIFLL